MGILQGIFKARDKPKAALGGSRFSFFFGSTSAGKPFNEQTAMQMTAVYSCVRILSETLAGLPLHVYQYNASGGKEKHLKHPLYKLLHDEPNPISTTCRSQRFSTVRRTTVSSSTSVLLELVLLPSQTMTFSHPMLSTISSSVKVTELLPSSV